MKIFRNSGAAEAKACDSMPEMREWQAKATSSLVQSGGRPVPASDTSALALNSAPVAPTPLPLKLRDTWKLENPQERKAPEDNAKAAPCPPPAKNRCCGLYLLHARKPHRKPGCSLPIPLPRRPAPMRRSSRALTIRPNPSRKKRSQRSAPCWRALRPVFSTAPA